MKRGLYWDTTCLTLNFQSIWKVWTWMNYKWKWMKKMAMKKKAPAKKISKAAAYAAYEKVEPKAQKAKELKKGMAMLKKKGN